jgi:hypothetical protein
MGTVKLKPVYTRTLVLTTESAVEIELQRLDHRQTIECVAKNKVGTLKKTIPLNVSCKLIWIFEIILSFLKLKLK